MNLPDDLIKRQQEAIAQALEMHQRAKKKGSVATQEPTINDNPLPKVKLVEVPQEVVPERETFGKRALSNENEIIIPPIDQSNLDSLQGQEFNDTVINETPLIDIDELREAPLPKRDLYEPFDWETQSHQNQEEFLENNQDQLYDWELEEDDFFKPLNRSEQDINNQSNTNPSNWNTSGYDEQYYQDIPASTPSNQKINQNNLPTTQWNDTTGYTEQYYDDETTYEEFSTGHTQENFSQTNTTQAQNNQQQNRQNTTYSNIHNPKPQQPSDSFDDKAILWLLLIMLIAEGNDMELVIALLYILG